MVDNVDEEKVGSDDELEQDITMNEEISIDANVRDESKEVSRKVEKKQAKKSSKEQDEKTYICPVCKEYSSSKFGSVNAHARVKHGRNVALDDDGNITILSSKKKEKDKEDKERPLTPYEEVEPADEFLRKFLTEFEFNEKFIDLLCRKVRRRNSLPYPNELARDIRTMPSGITNPNSADYIADEYGYDFKNYLERLEAVRRPHGSVGFDVSPHESHNTDYGGFPMRDRRIEPYRGIPLWDRDDSPMRERDGDERGRGRKEPDMDRPLTMKDWMMLQLQEENRRLKEGDGRKNPDVEQTWMRDRLMKMEDELRQRDAERMQRLEDELREARNIPPPQGPSGPSREEVMQMVERTIDAQTKKLTPDDVERIIQRTMGEYRPGSLTKNDLLYLEAKDKLHLEERKLDESGKTRDEISRAIRGGFSHAGKIISRMMTEEGGIAGMPVEGYSDKAGNMMQVACPGCNAVITASIGSHMVVCPGCGRRWTVERPGYEQIPPAEKFTSKEKEVIQKSVEDAREGRIKSLESSEVATSTVEVTSEPIMDTDVEKIAEGIALGEAIDKIEEELKKKKEIVELRQRHEEENERKRGRYLEKVEEAIKKPLAEKKMPVKSSRVCPICNKRFKNRHGVVSHIAQKHKEIKDDDKGPT